MIKKYVKKSLSLLLVLIMMLSLLPTQAFAVESSEEDHEHCEVCGEHECVCEEKADEADHTWVDGACSVCGAAQPLEVDDEAGFPWIIVIIAVLGVGAVVAAVILLKKKKK